jgi:hypothetical protein
MDPDRPRRCSCVPASRLRPRRETPPDRRDRATDKYISVDLGMALQLFPSKAEVYVEFAVRVEKLFPNVTDAMTAGVITERSAHAIVDPAED